MILLEDRFHQGRLSGPSVSSDAVDAVVFLGCHPLEQVCGWVVAQDPVKGCGVCVGNLVCSLFHPRKVDALEKFVVVYLPAEHTKPVLQVLDKLVEVYTPALVPKMRLVWGFAVPLSFPNGFIQIPYVVGPVHVREATHIRVPSNAAESGAKYGRERFGSEGLWRVTYIFFSCR